MESVTMESVTMTMARAAARAVLAAALFGVACGVWSTTDSSVAFGSSVAADPTTTVFGYDLANDPENCINFLPRPNCGREPQQAGDRGGALQYALLGFVLAGIATVGTVVVRNVMRRDRVIADRAIADRAREG